MKRLIFTLLPLLITASMTAAEHGRVAFNTLPVGNGLPHSDVTAIVQDKTGYLWFATYGGLCKYDGHRITTYRTDNSGLQRDRILTLHAASDSLLYIGTESGGVNIYDPKTDSIIPVKDDSESIRTTDDVVNYIFEDGEGTVWVCHNNMLSRIMTSEDGKGRIIRNCYRASSSGTAVTAGIAAGRDSIIISTYSGLKVYVRSTGQCHDMSNVVRSARCMTRTDDGILIGGYEGLVKLTCDGRFIDILDGVQVLSLMTDCRGNVLVGTFDDGLMEYDSSLKLIGQHLPDPFRSGSLSSSEICALCEDSSGMLWIGTIGGGLNTLDLHSNNIDCYTMAEGLSHNRVITFTEAPEGMLWISSHDGGIDIFDCRTHSFHRMTINGKPGSEFPVVSAFHEDADGNIWLGTWNNGIWTVSAGNVMKAVRSGNINAQRMQDQTVTGCSVFKIVDDRDGHIWVSSNKGLMEYIPDEGIWRTYRHDNMNMSSLYSDFLTDILPDPDTELKTIWIGTRAGLNKLVFDVDGTPHMHRVGMELKEEKQISKFISDIHRDCKGRLWIGTLGDGLYMMTAGRHDDGMPGFGNYSTMNCGFINNELESILEDDKGNLWIGGYGINRLDPETREVKSYTEKDNLQSNSFKIWAAYRMKDGRMVFGGTNGFNMFHPDSILTDTSAPKTVISSVKVKGVQVKDTSSLRLSHDQNSLTFEFAALTYRNPQYNSYRYRLSGYEKDWTTVTGNNPQCVYSNLRHGHYTFEVYGANCDGTWSVLPARLSLTIKPHFLQSTVAYIIYIIFLVLLIYGIYMLSLRHIRNKNEREAEQEKLRFFTDMAHEIKTPLSLISAPVEELLGSPSIGVSTRNRLHTVKKGIHSLQSVVEQILDLRKYEDKMMKLYVSEVDMKRFLTEVSELFTPLAASRRINFKTGISDTPLMVYIDKYKMERVVINLLSNAFKFTPEGGTVCMNCNEDGRYIVFSIEDNGVGMSEEDKAHIFERFYQGRNQSSETHSGTGIGLALSKYIVNHHKGEITVESRLNFGSKFTVRLLKGNAHFTSEQINTNYRNSDDLTNYEPVGSIPESFTAHGEKDATILVVDDNDQIRRYLCELLQSRYNVISAENGMKAYEMAIAEQPDLILSDIVMPEMSGIELCRRVKENENTSHIIVVLLTARDLVSTEIDSWKTGADGFITKPFHIGVLMSRIENLINSRDKMRKAFRSTLEVNPSEITVITSDERLMKKCLKAIEENMEDPEFGVEELSAAIGVSRAQLYRKIHSLTGLSSVQFIRSIRLKRAAQILLQDNSSVSDVMYQVGFSNLSYFSRLFKEEFGCMPKEYARRKSEENKN